MAIPAVNTGTCWYGNQNQKTYSGGLGETVTIDAGITGYCDGPGGQAIVARGNYEGEIDLNYPDSCNAAPKPYFHIQDTNYDGPNPQLIEMLNGWGQPGWGYETAIEGPYTCCSTVTDN